MSDRRDVVRAQMHATIFIPGLGQVGGADGTITNTAKKVGDLKLTCDASGLWVAFAGGEVLVPFGNLKSVQFAKT